MLSLIDIILLIVVAALLILAVIGAKRSSGDGSCGMNCAACGKKCEKDCTCNE